VHSKSLVPIKVHCWGGLGSQLYALALVEDLELSFKKRRIILVLHDGGVTKRTPEIIPFLKTNQFELVKDFQKYESNESTITNKTHLKYEWVTKYAGIILRKTGLVSNCNNDNQFNKLKPWIFSVRGHYSTRTISQYAVKNIILKFKPLLTEGQTDQSCLHYRLGDLVDLKTKQPNNSRLVVNAIKMLLNKEKVKVLNIFSDSPDLAYQLLKNNSLGVDLIVKNESVMKVFTSSVLALNFIGTSSKVTEWIAIFRLQLGLGLHTIVPESVQRHLISCYARNLRGIDVKTY